MAPPPPCRSVLEPPPPAAGGQARHSQLFASVCDWGGRGRWRMAGGVRGCTLIAGRGCRNGQMMMGTQEEQHQVANPCAPSLLSRPKQVPRAATPMSRQTGPGHLQLPFDKALAGPCPTLYHAARCPHRPRHPTRRPGLLCIRGLPCTHAATFRVGHTPPPRLWQVFRSGFDLPFLGYHLNEAGCAAAPTRPPIAFLHPSHRVSASPCIRVTVHPSHRASESPCVRFLSRPRPRVARQPPASAVASIAPPLASRLSMGDLSWLRAPRLRSCRDYRRAACQGCEHRGLRADPPRSVAAATQTGGVAVCVFGGGRLTPIVASEAAWSPVLPAGRDGVWGQLRRVRAGA